MIYHNGYIIMKRYHKIIIIFIINCIISRIIVALQDSIGRDDAILSLLGRKVIRHWFTEMLIGRWRPSAFSVSVFVISLRDSITKLFVESTLTTASPPAFAFQFLSRFRPTKESSKYEAVLMENRKTYERE